MINIKITSGKVVIPAVLNDTVAAKDFEKRLPFKVTGNDSGIDYCCVAKEGKSNPAERQTGWKNGDIEKEHLETLKNLPNTAEFLVESV